MALVQRRNTALKTKARDVEPEDDGDEEDERPARRSRASGPTFRAPERAPRRARDEDDEDEDERPARRRASRDEDEDERPRFRTRKGRDDEDDAPASDAVQSGWGAANKLKKEGGSFADEFQITKQEQLVKFVQDEPYAVYKQHWIESGLRSTKKKSFICMGKGCPLCAIGEQFAKKWAFNVAVFEDGEWEIKSLIAGSRLYENIADEHEGADGPLDQGFWTISKSGVKQSTTYKVKSIEGRKLEEKFRVDEAELEELLEEADLVPYTAKQHMPPTKSYLQEIADELVGADD